MKKALIVANMLFASAVVFGMENPAQISVERFSQNQRLETALLEKNIEHVVQSIDEGAEINALMSNGHTPLTFAVNEGNLDLTNILIGLGADVNRKNSNNDTPLTISIANCSDKGKESIVDLLLQSEDIDLELPGVWGLSPLALAMEMDSVKIDLQNADKSRLDMTKKLVQAGANVNGVAETEGNLDTCLIRAVMYRNEFMVRLLITNGVNLAAKNRYGDTAASLAARWGYEDMLELLSIPTQNDVVQLLNAWKNQLSYSSNILQSFRTAVPEIINEKNNNGYTMLMSALEQGQNQMAKWLIENGADVNLQNNAGKTALMFAAKGGYTEIVRDLLKKGAHTNLRDKENHAALWFAEQSNHNDIIEILNSVDR